MEPVKQFNQELSSLYEIKPPISKAKMTAITKGAIRAIKYYKHVVQSVEKFIQKCRPEYKIPGLYVIDSIVRQSRHQFGSEKDVFAPRFAKNIRLTFFNLYKCTEEEKSKVIRVLNLWQKNEVFQSDVIQPLFDLANPNSELSKQMEDQSKRGLLGTGGGGSGGEKPIKTPTISIAPETQTQNRQPSLNQQQPDEQVKSRRGRHGGGQTTPTEMDQQVYQQLQTIQQLLKNHVPTSAEQVKFNKKLLDFDYSDDEEGGVDGPEARPSAAMLEVLQGILSSERVLQKLKSMGEISDGQIQQLQQLIPQFQALQQPQQQQQQQQQQMQPPTQQIHQQIQQQPFLRVSPQVASVFPPQHSIGSSPQPSVQPIQGFGQFGPGFQMSDPNQMSGISVWGAPSQPLLLDDPIEDDIQILEDRSNAAATWRREGRSIRSSRSRSGSRERRRGGRSGGRRSSRSRSRSRDRGSRRRRSRSPRDRKESEKDREKKREREKKGLPPLKKNCLGVCSTTLWVGHLSRLVGDEDLSDMFGEFGAIESINLIPPRGCAFICMNRRQDAYKALKTLNKTKIHGKPITIAWAPGKCMKDKQWKDYWDVELGVSYIPYDKLDPQVNFADLEEGGMFDEDTVPDWLKNLRDNAPMQINSQPFQEQAKQQLPGPPPGFVRIPEGISPAIGATPTPQETIQIPVPGPHPPGMPPFGLPPGLAQAGLLPSPAVLAGAQAILNAQGAPRLIGPPGILLPRFGLAQPPPMGGHPPPGFPPSFDISQPPPGLRPPFPQLGQAPPQISDAGSDDMDIDQDVPTIQPVITNDRMKNDRDRDRTSRDRGSRDRDRGDRDRLSRDRDRLSRDRDRDRDRGDRERDRGDRDRDRRDRPRESRWSRVEKSPEKVPEGKDNRSSRDDSLLSRLRNIAGHVESEGQKSKQDQRDGRDSGPPHPREHGDRGPPPFDRRDGPPPFGTPGGPPPRFGGPQGRFPGPNQIRGDKPGGDQGPGPRFNGPPGPGGFRNEGPGGFRNGPPPPHFHNGGQPPFRDGQGGPPPPFGGSNEAGSPFGGDFNMRGGRGNFWRGRGGRGGPMGPMGGPGGRGGFRGGFDGPPNMMGGDNFDGFPNDRDGGWPDGGGPPGRGRGRGGWRGGPPHNEHFDRSGGPEPFDRNNRPGDFNRDRDRRSRENDRSFGSKDDDDRRSRDRDREDSKERSENRREKRSRWGGGDNANSESPDHSKSNNKPGLLGDWKSPDSNLEKQNDDPPHKEKETVVASAQIEVAPSHDSEKEVGHFDPESATESKAQPEPNSRISDSEQNSRNPNEIESDTRISDSEQNARIPIESDSNTPQAFEQEKQADIFRPQEQSFSESLYDSESQQDFDSRSNDIEMRPESSLDADSQPGIGFRNVNQPETEDESARHGTDEAQFQPTAAEPQEFFPTTEPDFSNDVGHDVGNDMGNDASQASFRNDVGNDMGNDASQTSFRNDVGNDMGNDASHASFISEGDSHTGYNNEESRERSDNTEPPSFEAHVPDFSASNDDFSVDNFEAEPEAGVALAASTSESEPPVNHDVAEQESAE